MPISKKHLKIVPKKRSRHISSHRTVSVLSDRSGNTLGTLYTGAGEMYVHYRVKSHAKKSILIKDFHEAMMKLVTY